MVSCGVYGCVSSGQSVLDQVSYAQIFTSGLTSATMGWMLDVCYISIYEMTNIRIYAVFLGGIFGENPNIR